MILGYEGFLALKQLKQRRKNGFISLISFISVGGVAVGVMALIIVLAVMSGFDRELKAKIVNVQPHLRIERVGGIENVEGDIQTILNQEIDGLLSVAPFIEGQAILRSRTNATGVMIKGTDASREDISIYQQHLVAGELDFSDRVTSEKTRRFLFFRKTVEEHVGSVLIGQNLAAILRVRVGDTVQLISPFQEKQKPGLRLSPSQAESRPFVVKGIYRVGMNDFDTSLALISLHQAQALYHLENRVTGLSLRFAEVDDARQWKHLLRVHFGPEYYLRSWFDLNQNFFQALQVEKSVMTILLALIILVAAFNIVSTLIMIVMEKTQDIGILRALGSTRASIRKVFMIQGFAVGSLGVAVGAGLGLIGAMRLNSITDFIRDTTGFELFPSDIYLFDRIPTEIHSADVMLIVSFALLASILAGIYPAHRASSLNPVEALRYG